MLLLVTNLIYPENVEKPGKNKKGALIHYNQKSKDLMTGSIILNSKISRVHEEAPNNLFEHFPHSYTNQTIYETSKFETPLPSI